MSGTIAFKTYPVNQRTHGVFAEINPQLSGGTGNQRTLILGQMLSTGTAAADVPFLGLALADAKVQLGAGSQLALMYQWYRNQDSVGEVWLAPLADPAGGTPASGFVTFGGTTTGAGTVSLYVAGTLEPLPVASGTSAAAIATAWAAVVNADLDAPVTATVAASGVAVTLTAKNKGIIGNEIDIRANYLGSAGGEVTPAGLTITPSSPPFALGAGTPATDLATVLGNLGTKTFDFIVCPYTDAASLNALANFLNTTTGRWSWQQQLYGHVFTAVRGTAGTLASFGNTRNEFTASCMGFNDSPTPAWLWAADLAGACAVSLKADPGQPLQELVLNALAPPIASQFSLSLRNTLLYDGISTFTVNDAGQAIIDRMITFYQSDASGADDTTWLNTETPFMTVDLTRDTRNYLQTTYGRKKLVIDGTNIPGGSNMVTSQIVLAATIARYKMYCDTGRAQNYAYFKANAKAENVGGGRLNMALPFVLDDQLRQMVLSIDFVPNS